MRPPSLTPARLTAAALVLAGVALAQGDLKAKLLALLPTSVQYASMLNWSRQPQIVSIEQRILRAGAQDPRWFRSYFASLQPGDTPAYDVRLGVSADEYKTWLVFKNSYRLQPVGTARFYVTRTGNKLVFNGSQGAESLRGLTIDLVTGELRTPEGFGAQPHPVYVSAAQDQFGIGERSGWGWKVEGSNPTTKNAILANLNVWQLAGNGVLINYNRKSLINGARQAEIDLNLRYTK